jgi:hypothetical protein
VLGKEHPNTLMSMNNLANVLNDQGKYELADEMYQQARTDGDSARKRTISADRHRLGDDTIKYLELLKYWWLRKLATQIRRNRGI